MIMIALQYHLVKANVVANALSRNSTYGNWKQCRLRSRITIFKP